MIWQKILKRNFCFGQFCKAIEKKIVNMKIEKYQIGSCTQILYEQKSIFIKKIQESIEIS